MRINLNHNLGTRIVYALSLLVWLIILGIAYAAETTHVVLGTLDKVTARVSTLTLEKDSLARFGKLEIIMQHCDRTPPTEIPESTALLEIGENLKKNEPNVIFHGWMFASSPAVSSLEHPVYDVWVLECLNLSPQ